MEGFFSKLLGVIFSPKKFFKSLEEKSIIPSLTFFYCLLFAVAIIQIIFLRLSSTGLRDIGYLFEFNSSFSLFLFMIYAVILPIIPLLSNLILRKYDFSTTYKRTFAIFAYGFAPSIMLSLIPLIGFILFFYSLFVVAIGIKQVYSLKWGRVILASLFNLAFHIGIYLFFGYIIILALAGASF